MKKISFPVFKTKSPPAGRAGPPGSPKFDLSDPKQRAAYFDFKVGAEIRKIRDYLEGGNTFVALLLGKKNSGKGTYTKLFMEAIGSKHIAHLSIGDVVRSVDEEVRRPKKRQELVAFLEKNYRGWVPLGELIKAQLSRSTKTLLPTEYVLALVKREIAKLGRKAIFIDGFPRDLDQVSYSLFFRDLIGFREDPDFFILIDIPESVIDERIKHRVVCPKCQTPRNLKLLRTRKVKYDSEKKEFYLVCDSSECGGVRMVSKEGDELGIKVIRDRLKKDEDLIHRAFDLHGIPKILLRNAVPVKEAEKMVDDYELTPEYVYHWEAKKKRVKIEEKSWTVKDDNDISSYSLLAPAVVVSLITQLADLL